MSPRRRWHEAYHLKRLLRRASMRAAQVAQENRAFKAHVWQAALAGSLVFWGAVAYGIHSL